MDEFPNFIGLGVKTVPITKENTVSIPDTFLERLLKTGSGKVYIVDGHDKEILILPETVYKKIGKDKNYRRILAVGEKKFNGAVPYELSESQNFLTLPKLFRAKEAEIVPRLQKYFSIGIPKEVKPFETFDL